MAHTLLNPGMRELSGDLAGWVYRRNADGSVSVAKIARRDPNRVPTANQQAHQERFKQASAHCQRLLAEPATLALYKHVQAKRGPMARLRAMVIGDILQAPTITSVDVSNYHGAVGDIIVVKAKDNMAVAQATVTIRDQSNNRVVETLNYVPAPEQLADTVEWMFKATTPVPIGHSAVVEVVASDLAGNTYQMSQPV